MSIVIVTATVDLEPGQVEDGLAMSIEHVRRSRAEPGCLLHSVSRDAESPNRLLFLEHWADRAALQAHFAVPAARDFSRALAGMATTPAELKIYEAEAFTPGR